MISVNNIAEEERFYSEPFFLSYSGLNQLLYSPKLFYNKYILGQKEEKLDAHLVEGKLIHCLILEPEKFNEQFIVAPGKVPKDNAKIIVDTMYAKTQLEDYSSYDFKDFESEILELMMSLNYYQNLKTDAQRLEKVITDDNIAYFEFLKQQSTKILIDEKTLEKCKESANEILADERACEVLCLKDGDGRVIHNELPLKINSSKRAFGLKGFIDRLIIDYHQKKITICDIKSTSKPINKFPETIEYYRYDLQAAMYCTLVAMTLHKDIENFKEFDIEFVFIVIDPFKQVYPFFISKSTLNNWVDNLNTEIDKFDWHYTNKNFTLPYELIKERVIL